MSFRSHFDPSSLLELCTVPRIGSARIRNLITRFGSPGGVLSASPRELAQVDGIDKKVALNIKRGGNKQFVSEQLQLLKQAGGSLVSLWDDYYPPLLKKIYDPPILLFVRGNLKSLCSNCFSIVGTRYPSSYGKINAEKFARELAQQSFTIISGLARGVDTAVHRAVVSSGEQTVAILGSGIDTIYPYENNKLAEQITERGALVSEFPMGTKPDAPHFPRRNRIISGICMGTLVIEAGEKSGALITADFALEQGREVFAMPGSVNNPKALGTNRLIQQGAKLTIDVKDILEELHVQIKETQFSKKPNIPLSEVENKVLNFLSTQPEHIDNIATQCSMPTSEVLGVLLTLELKNVVKQLVGKNFVRI